MTIYKGYDVVVSDSDGASFTIGVCGDLPVYYDENYVSDDDNSSFCGTVILSDLDSAYTMTPGDTVTEVSYTLEYNDSLLIVEGTSVDTIEITQTSVSVSGTDSDVSLGLISNDGYYVTPWYKAELSAEDVDDLSLSMSDTGYVVEGTDLSDITVYGTNDYETVELTFSTDKEKALVTEDSAENMIVLIDEDNNGTYETVIATTDYAGLVEEAKATLSSTDWTLTQSDVESATGSTTADKIATLIDAILAGLGIDSNVTVTFTITDITEAIASDATDVDGTDGSFTINFTISAGNESDTLTETGAITATAYVHTHSLTHVEAVDATCTAVGNTEYWYCSGCDKYYSDENAENEITLADTVTAKIAHNYEAVVTDPTCTEGGYTTYTCSVCKDSYVADEVEATGHNYEAVVTEPTCTESGYTTYTCSVCKDSYVADEVEAIGHSYEAVVTEPTCTEGGYTTYTCSVCKDSYVADETAATGHSYEAVVTEPTCTEGGYTTYTCSVCKDSYVADETAALGHDYTSEVTKEATRTEAGVMTYTCTRGDDSYTVEIPATGHTEAEAVVENEVAATCTTDGSYDSVVYCSDCGEELSRETIVVPAAHTAGTAVRENVVEATRTTEGSYDLVTYCTVCGEEISRETVTVPATGVDMITVWLRTPADYSAVNNAIAKANALNPDDYTNFSDVTDAINAVNWTYNALMQSYVNEMAEKIETAIANLIPVGTTTEEVEIQEPIEDTNTDTEDDEEGSSEISEPETNPTTGIAFSLLPMMIAALAAASTKRR
ncbi:MAG: hypothetical protein LIO49_07240 [Ruminococcus sp.]|nr:hypothetical protein [Ruminococcus sp.]